MGEDGRTSAAPQVPKGWQDIGWEQATCPTGAQKMSGYRLRAGHLPKRHAQNTEGMDEDGMISAESMPPAPQVLKGWEDIG